jgi:hypothetical protein
MKHAVLTALLVMGGGLMGCGRPATPEECQEIVERITRLEAARVNPGRPERVEEEVDKAKKDPVLRERASKECVGHPISERALACIRDAQTSQEITEQCLH